MALKYLQRRAGRVIAIKAGGISRKAREFGGGAPRSPDEGRDARDESALASGPVCTPNERAQEMTSVTVSINYRSPS